MVSIVEIEHDPALAEVVRAIRTDERETIARDVETAARAAMRLPSPLNEELSRHLFKLARRIRNDDGRPALHRR